MRSPLPLGGFVLAAWFVFATSAPVRAAAPKDIDAAIQRGADFLKQQSKLEGPAVDNTDGNAWGIQAIMGLALIEAGVPTTDPAIKTLAARIRKASFYQTRTYPLSLFMLFLDHLGDAQDVPLIQMLGVRLVAGQTSQGGWLYECVEAIPLEEVQQLQAKIKVKELITSASKPDPVDKDPSASPKVSGRLHPEIVRYARTILGRPRRPPDDDNSNTQFAIMGLWTARKHGVEVEDALTLLEQRFLRSQRPTGGWGYKLTEEPSSSMTCAGLLGIASGLARRDAKKTANEPKSKTEPKSAKPGDPFFNPPQGKGEDKKNARRPNDAWELSARAGLIAISRYLDSLRTLTVNDAIGHGDLYFYWSVERVAVVYKLEKINGVDWYALGSDSLLRAQTPQGYWAYPTNGVGAEVGTSLALLFLCKANLTRDLNAIKDEGQFSELRSNDTGSSETTSGSKNPAASIPPIDPKPTSPIASLPSLASDEAVPVAAELLKANDADWSKALAKLKDAKGAIYTRGMVLAVNRLDGGRKRDVREALAERLTRMTAVTLREMLKSDEPELRRAAVLACAMKDDAEHIPDLIDRLTDDSAVVWPAAKAGLKSLTGQDLGPSPTATSDERRKAAEAWKAWLAKKGK